MTQSDLITLARSLFVPHLNEASKFEKTNC